MPVPALPPPPTARERLLADLGKRTQAGFAMATIAAVAIWLGGWILLAGIVIAMAFMAWEWVGLTGSNRRRRRQSAIIASVPIIITASLLLNAELGVAPLWLRLLEVALVLSVLLLVFNGALFSTLRERRWAWTGIFYLAVPAIAVILVREPEHGPGHVLWFVAVVIATDCFAFVVGSALRGPRLWPRISPSKTWSGLLGGMVAAALCGGMAAGLVQWSTVTAVGVGAVLALCSQGGDLFESWLKRRAGVKDSGVVIPGHGGVMDRLDGYVFSAPVFALIIALGSTP